MRKKAVDAFVSPFIYFVACSFIVVYLKKKLSFYNSFSTLTFFFLLDSPISNLISKF